jgi:hypothetical protein
MMKHNPHPSCKPSNDKKHHLPKNSPPKVAPHSKREKNQEQELEMSLSQESKLCYDKMRGNVLYLYDLMTFN